MSKAKKEGNFKFGHKGTGITPLRPDLMWENPRRLSTKALVGDLCIERRLCAFSIHTLRWPRHPREPYTSPARARVKQKVFQTHDNAIRLTSDSVLTSR